MTTHEATGNPKDRATELARALADDEVGSDAAKLIHELRHLGGPEMAPIVMPFIHASKEPFAARAALETLCSWGLAGQIAGEIEGFVRGVDWDLDSGGYVRLVAAVEAGRLANSAPATAPSLIDALVRLTTNADEDVIARDAAYAGLLLARGATPAQLPSASRVHGPATYDAQVIAWAQGASSTG